MSTAAAAVIVSAAVFGVVAVPAAALVEFFPHLPFSFVIRDTTWWRSSLLLLLLLMLLRLFSLLL